MRDMLNGRNIGVLNKFFKFCREEFSNFGKNLKQGPDAQNLASSRRMKQQIVKVYRKTVQVCMEYNKVLGYFIETVEMFEKIAEKLEACEF